MSHPALPRKNTAAVVSLVFGILAWILLPVVGSLVAVILGHSARREIREAHAAGESMEGDEMAVIGLVLGWAQLGIMILTLLVILFMVLFFGGLAFFTAA